ncbi:pentapeptide repeat-containing protein [Kitasatospora sp. NPDC048286]
MAHPTEGKLRGVSFADADLSRARFSKSALERTQLTRTRLASIVVVSDSD